MASNESKTFYHSHTCKSKEKFTKLHKSAVNKKKIQINIESISIAIVNDEEHSYSILDDTEDCQLSATLKLVKTSSRKVSVNLYIIYSLRNFLLFLCSFYSEAEENIAEVGKVGESYREMTTSI